MWSRTSVTYGKGAFGNASIGMPVMTSNSVRMVPPPKVGTFM